MTDILYKKADISDLEDVCALVTSAVEGMNADGIDQWDEVYPSREVLRSDIERGEMQIGFIGENPAVIYVVNTDADEQYANGTWAYNGSDFAVIHRLCVSPEFQRRGIASGCLEHIERELKDNGVKAVKLDVFTENPFALRLYEKHGYSKVGTAHWRKGDFCLMEKLL